MDAPAIPSGQELYDFIMMKIEPELTSSGLLTLEEKYVNETDDQKAERAARYDVAFAEYDKQFQAYNDTWMADLRNYKRAAMASLEQESRETEDKNALTSIESSLAA